MVRPSGIDIWAVNMPHRIQCAFGRSVLDSADCRLAESGFPAFQDRESSSWCSYCRNLIKKFWPYNPKIVGSI